MSLLVERRLSVRNPYSQHPPAGRLQGNFQLWFSTKTLTIFNPLCGFRSKLGPEPLTYCIFRLTPAVTDCQRFFGQIGLTYYPKTMNVAPQWKSARFPGQLQSPHEHLSSFPPPIVIPAKAGIQVVSGLASVAFPQNYITLQFVLARFPGGLEGRGL